MSFCDVAVEGAIDEAVVRRLLPNRVEVRGVYGRGGKQDLLRRLEAYNTAAAFGAWVVLIDLDHDAKCPGEYRQALLRRESPGLRLRIAVREVETWLLADHVNVASFLGVPRAAVPAQPELESNAKQTLVNLARRSRLRAIRELMVPTQGSGRSVGIGYSGLVIGFIGGAWDPAAACTRSTSLAGCVRRLEELG